MAVQIPQGKTLPLFMECLIPSFEHNCISWKQIDCYLLMPQSIYDAIRGIYADFISEINFKEPEQLETRKLDPSLKASRSTHSQTMLSTLKQGSVDYGPRAFYYYSNSHQTYFPVDDFVTVSFDKEMIELKANTECKRVSFQNISPNNNKLVHLEPPSQSPKYKGGTRPINWWHTIAYNDPTKYGEFMLNKFKKEFPDWKLE